MALQRPVVGLQVVSVANHTQVTVEIRVEFGVIGIPHKHRLVSRHRLLGPVGNGQGAGQIEQYFGGIGRHLMRLL